MPEGPYEVPRQIQSIHEFSRGFVMGLSPGKVPPEAALWAINIDHARGGLRNRRGRERVGQRLPAASSTCYWLGQYRRHMGAGTPVTLQNLRVNATDLYELVGEVWTYRGSMGFRRLTTGLQFHNRMWLGEGSSMKVWDGSTIQSWGFNAPEPLVYVSTAETGGYLFADGVYGAVIILYSSTTGEGTNPSSELELTMGAGSDVKLVTCTVPAMTIEPRFDKVRVYRTAEGEALHEYESEHDYSGSEISITVGSREDSNLGAVVDYESDPPPGLDWFLKFQGRFFGVSPDDPSVLRWCQTNRPWAWPALSNLPIDQDDGDELQGGLVLHGTLYVFKRRAPYAVNEHPLFGYVATEMPADVGTLSHHSLVVVGNYAYGLDERGLWVFNGAQFQRLTDQAMDFFLKSRRDDKSLESVAVHDARPDRPFYRVILRGPDPRDADAAFKTWWVNMHEPTKSLDLYEDWDANVLAVVQNSQFIPEVWSGDDQGCVYRHFEDADGEPLYHDEDPDGVPGDIDSDYRTADIALGETFGESFTPEGDRPGGQPRYHAKEMHGIYVEFEQSVGPPPTVLFTSYLDGLSVHSYERGGYDDGKITESIYWRGRATPFRRAGLRVQASGTFDMRLVGFAFEFSPLGIRLRGEPPASW